MHPFRWDFPIAPINIEIKNGIFHFIPNTIRLAVLPKKDRKIHRHVLWLKVSTSHKTGIIRSFDSIIAGWIYWDVKIVKPHIKLNELISTNIGFSFQVDQDVSGLSILEVVSSEGKRIVWKFKLNGAV